MTKTIALITDSQYPHISLSDKQLIQPFKAAGYKLQALAWDVPNQDLTRYESLIFRSSWNYFKKPDIFLDWLTKVEQARVRVWNEIPLIRWNMNKAYLLDLEQCNIRIIPTRRVKRQETIDMLKLKTNLEWPEIVLKPAIGAHSHMVRAFTATQTAHAQAYAEEILQHQDLIVQPLIPESKNIGEFSLIFFNHHYSHAIMKHEGKTRLVTPPGDLVLEAKKILQIISEPLLYVRVDGFLVKKTFYLLELELFEPQLYFNLYPPSAKSFTQAYLDLRH